MENLFQVPNGGYMFKTYSFKNFARFSLAVIVCGTVAVTSVFAQDVIQARKALMKNNLGAMKAAAGMAKGKIPFDAQKAQLSMITMNSVAIGLGELYGSDSKPPANTKAKFSAAPKIWKNMADFKTAVAKFRMDTSAAIKAAGEDEGAWKAAFGNVAKNCQSCHQEFRVKNN